MQNTTNDISLKTSMIDRVYREKDEKWLSVNSFVNVSREYRPRY